MSIDQFMYSWKAGSYDRIECVERDADGNPLHIRFWRKSKLILEVFIVYDEHGEWMSISSKLPEKEKKK